ncbi:MAG: biotin--[acetyl-CoA-carboxylase] ligase [Bacteroidales bacterium]|nr:biotin--[acetyl-CoA-carboxylase] ligase [Bacteroidales bacterium]
MKTFTAADLHFIAELSSSNSLLRELWKKEPFLNESYALASFNQTAGRGQQNNVWESEADKNIAYSVFLRPRHLSPAFSFVLSQAVSLALLETLQVETGIHAEIKWPNDIYVEDKKIAGILIENELQGKSIQSSIVGIGLNVNQERFSPSLPNPVSIFQLCGRTHNLQTLTFALHSRLGEAYAKTFTREGQTEIIADYHRHLYRREGFHSFKEGERLFRAKLLRVLPGGQLELQSDEGLIRSFAYKEIEYLI